MLGDVSGDGAVDTKDALWICRLFSETAQWMKT